MTPPAAAAPASISGAPGATSSAPAYAPKMATAMIMPAKMPGPRQISIPASLRFWTACHTTNSPSAPQSPRVRNNLHWRKPSGARWARPPLVLRHRSAHAADDERRRERRKDQAEDARERRGEGDEGGEDELAQA